MTAYQRRPFTSDGCSGLFMSLLHCWWQHTGRSELSRNITALCKKHDQVYWAGGSAVARAKADAMLMIGVAELGKPFLARCMLLGVSIGGHPLVPRHWRWDYGLPWPTYYRKDGE